MHLVAVGAVAVAAFGLLGLTRMDLPKAGAVDDGDRIQIEVVPPIEPTLTAGSVMEVGELVNGFTHVPAPPAPEAMEPAYAPYDEWEAANVPSPPARSGSYDEAVVRGPPQPEASEDRRGDRGGRWFGFDAPRRDYQAEREARRARLEAMDRREFEREQEWRARREMERDRYQPPPERQPYDRWD